MLNKKSNVDIIVYPWHYCVSLYPDMIDMI